MADSTATTISWNSQASTTAPSEALHSDIPFWTTTSTSTSPFTLALWLHRSLNAVSPVPKASHPISFLLLGQKPQAFLWAGHQGRGLTLHNGPFAKEAPEMFHTTGSCGSRYFVWIQCTKQNCWWHSPNLGEIWWHSPNLKLLFSHSVVSSSLWLHGLQHTRLPCPSPSPGACSNSCQLSRWYHPTISPSVALFSFCLQSFPASGSFPMSQLFTSGGQTTGVSALASVHPMSVQGWFHLRLTGLILLSKGLSRVFPSTTVQKHHFFSTQPSLQPSKYNHAWLLERL